MSVPGTHAVKAAIGLGLALAWCLAVSGADAELHLVPEPGTLVLLGLAAVVLARAGRRRRS